MTYNYDLLRRLTDILIELEDKHMISCLTMYPTDVAKELINVYKVELSTFSPAFINVDPCQYRPRWSIYKLIAEGFSWKGRRHK